MVATVHVDLSDHAGGDSIPRARALRFDPLGDTLAGTAVLVDAVTVQIDRSTGQASHVNGRAVAGGLVPLAAGVVYRLSGLAQTHTVGPLADGDAVELSAVIVPGEPLSPTAEAALAARLTVLEATPPGGAASEAVVSPTEGTITLAPVHGCTHTLTLTGDATVTLAAAPGTVSAIRVGHPDHPLDAVWDTATTACAPGTIDTWRAPGWGGDGVHPSATAHTGLAVPTAAFTATLL